MIQFNINLTIIEVEILILSLELINNLENWKWIRIASIEDHL